MKTQIPVLVFLALISPVVCQSLPSSSGYDYNYPSTTLLNVTNPEQMTIDVDTNFKLVLQNASFSHFSVNANSSISFVGSVNGSSAFGEESTISIDCADNTMTSLTVTYTSDNLTVHYKGRRSASSETGGMSWKLTFYRQESRKFLLDMLSNNMSDAGSGASSICTASSCSPLSTSPDFSWNTIESEYDC